MTSSPFASRSYPVAPTARLVDGGGLKSSKEARDRCPSSSLRRRITRLCPIVLHGHRDSLAACPRVGSARDCLVCVASILAPIGLLCNNHSLDEAIHPFMSHDRCSACKIATARASQQQLQTCLQTRYSNTSPISQAALSTPRTIKLVRRGAATTSKENAGRHKAS
jgi:hypothetical protein